MVRKMSFPLILMMAMVFSACGSQDETLNPDWVSRANGLITLSMIESTPDRQLLSTTSYFLGNSDTSDDSTRTNHVVGSNVLPAGRAPINTNFEVLYRNPNSTSPVISPAAFLVVHACDVYRLGWMSTPYYYSIENVKFDYDAVTGIVSYSYDLIYTAYYWRYAYVQLALNTTASTLGQVTMTLLDSSSVRFSITLAEKKDVVHFFAKRNGIQDFDAINVQSVGEIANADGTYTYQVVRPAAYNPGDVVVARCFTYTPKSGQVFYPGPIENSWSDPITVQELLF